jgi:serine/threonine protein kinase
LGKAIKPPIPSAGRDDCKTLPRAVEEVFVSDAVPDEWLVIYTFEDAAGCGKQWFRDAERPATVTPMRLPPEARGVILLCDAETYQPARQVLVGLGKANRDVPPVAVMFLADPHSDPLSTGSDVLRAQEELQEAGANDVCLKPADGSFALALNMSMQRANNNFSMMCEYERHISKQTGRISDLQDSMWSQVPNCLPEFPRVQSDGPGEIGPGDRVGDCALRQKVGSGRLGKVYAAVNQRLRRAEAVKVVDKAGVDHLTDIQDMFREITLLSRLQHPNVVQFYGFLHTSHFLLISMELAGSRNLFRFMCDISARLTVENARQLAAQMTQAVAHCHERGVAHCDLKPENVVVSKNGTHAMLVDFGFAVETACSTCQIVRGTMPFIAPEVMVQRGFYTPAPVDIWSVGVLILEMTCGLQKMNRMMQWDEDERPHERLSAELKSFLLQPEAIAQALEEDEVEPTRGLMAALLGALQVSPASRWTATELASCEWLLVGDPESANIDSDKDPYASPATEYTATEVMFVSTSDESTPRHKSAATTTATPNGRSKGSNGRA